MATFFGEVLPIPSRAFDEDEEFDIAPEGINLTIKNEGIIKEQVRILILTVGTSVSWFAKCYLLSLGTKSKEDDISPVIVIERKVQTDQDDTFISGLDYKKGKNNVLGTVYKHPVDTDVLVGLLDNVKQDSASEVMSQLFNMLKFNPQQTRIVALTSENSVGYKFSHLESTAEEIDFPTARYLLSSEFRTSLKGQEIKLKILETPNIIGGVTAAALTECEVRGIAGLAMICYEMEPGSSIDFLHQQFKSLPIQNMAELLTNKKFLNNPSYILNVKDDFDDLYS